MNSLIRIGILWCLAIPTVGAQEAAKFIEESPSPSLETEEPSPLPASEVRPVNGQPSPFRPLRSEPPRRVAEPKRIVIQPGVDAQESEVVWQFLADLEKAGIAKVIETEMTPTSESPIVTQVFMREDESFEKIKLFLVDLRASGVEKLVLELGGIHPEGDADKQHNGLVFRATRGYSQDELQRLEKVIQAAAERCGVSLYLAGTHVVPSERAASGPPDKKPSDREAEGYAPSPGSRQPVTKTVLPSSKAIVLVIDADAQKSKVVKEVIAALEKAGIATGQSAETVPPTNSPISVTLGMRKDESYDKIKQLIETLKDAGVQQISIRVGGVSTEGEEERNILILHLQQGFTRDELHKIETAATTKADQCGLRLFIATQNLAQPAGEFFGPAVVEEQPEDEDKNIFFSPSSEKVIPGTNTATISNTSKISEMREAYESESKFTLSLADVLRQIQNSKDPARIAQFAANKEILRTKVHRAFTLRQSLLQAELLEMQARMEKTQQSLDRRDRMADQIVDRRVEDLLNPQLKWDDEDLIKTTSTITSTLTAPTKPKTTAQTIAELEGDWHRMSASGAETPHFNISIHGNTWTKFVDQNPEAVEFICDSAKKTIEFKSTPPLVYTYQVHDDSLILHNETQTQAFNRGHRLPPV
jgi:hypothetical protein